MRKGREHDLSLFELELRNQKKQEYNIYMYDSVLYERETFHEARERMCLLHQRSQSRMKSRIRLDEWNNDTPHTGCRMETYREKEEGGGVLSALSVLATRSVDH